MKRQTTRSSRSSKHALPRPTTTLPLQRLDKEITRLKEQLAQLKSERARLYGYRVQHKSMLSPIRRMPTEVLGEIFAWTSPVVPDSWRLVVRHPNYTQLMGIEPHMPPLACNCPCHPVIVGIGLYLKAQMA
ncbi:hypothetical protein DFH06DRAFT_1209723 [Mycena polygramma]|nr:hypothetical protein DFH06DRAFT_1209723 [Mycena polygramma]